jgi:membrane protein DedA with SNARE-associated domain
MNDWLLLQNGWWLYISLTFLLLGGAVGLPIPEDIPVILAGILAYRGNAQPEILLLVCYVAIVSGDVFIFWVGRKFGNKLFKQPWFKARMPLARVREIRKRLERRRFITIFVARHLFYLRTITFLICGAVKMRFALFLVADMIAALISVPIMFGLGYLAAEHYSALMSGVEQAKHISLLVGGLAIIGVGFWYWRRKRLARNTPSDNRAPTDGLSEHGTVNDQGPRTI